MKFTVNFKTPDALDYALKDALDNHDFEEFSKINNFVKKWIKYGECVSIEFDMVAGTATVLEK